MTEARSAPRGGQQPCPQCDQDWVHTYRRKDTGALFFMCPECESLWLNQEDVNDPTNLYLSEYMAQYDAVSVWKVIQQVS